MAKIKTTCHICSYVTKSEGTPASCEKCHTSLTDPEVEKLIKFEYNIEYSSKVKGGGKSAHLYLTNKRLLWIAIREVPGANMFGLIGGLVNVIFSSTKWGGAIPLEDIESFEDGKMGLLSKAFIVNTKSGTVAKFNASPIDEWKNAIMEAKTDKINS